MTSFIFDEFRSKSLKADDSTYSVELSADVVVVIVVVVSASSTDEQVSFEDETESPQASSKNGNLTGYQLKYFQLNIDES